MKKNTIRLTESKLRGMIREVVSNILSESFYNNYKSDEYNSIVDKLARYLIEEYVGDLSIFRYATDLQECDYDDIQRFCALYAQGDYPDEWEDDETGEEGYDEFSIKKWNSGYKYELGRIGTYFEDLVSDNWQDWLSGGEQEVIYDRHDIASVSDKYAYGGGGFEAMRDFEIDVAKRIADIIKSNN